MRLERFYKFKYVTKDGVQKKRRLAVILENNTGLLLTWDFTANGYRNFEEDQIYDAEDVTGKCYVTNDIHKTFKNPNVRTFVRGDTLYAVNF
jgi:predicted DNA-binding transcriptional regulator YafY